MRRFVGATFLALAAYVLIQSAWVLWAGDAPEESLVGLVLAMVSLVVMPLIAWGKLRAAEAIGSGALRAEAKEWSITRGARNGRVAWQFIQDLAGRQGVKLD